MLYPSETYSSLAPLKICHPLDMRVQVPPSAPASPIERLNKALGCYAATLALNTCHASAFASAAFPFVRVQW